MNFSTKVKKKLFELIDEMDSCHWLFTKNPEKDFSNTTPTNSSFNQRRAQILPRLLSFCFMNLQISFNKEMHNIRDCV